MLPGTYLETNLWPYGNMAGYLVSTFRRNGRATRRSCQAALRDLGDSLAEIRRDTGLSEEELIQELLPAKREGQELGRTGG